MRHRSKYRSISPITFNLLHSKSTYFYKWWYYLIPSVCILALLVGLYVSINPNVLHSNLINNIHTTYATSIGEATNPGSGNGDTPSISISLPTAGLPDGFDNATNQVTNATSDAISYRSNIFNVQAANIDIYHVGIRSAANSNGELVGEQQNYAISGVGKNVAVKNFPDNTWGYALTENVNEIDANLSYTTLPSDMNASQIQTFFTSSNETRRFKITFAAKFGKYTPSDHYKTQVSLFAIMDPRSTVGFNGALTMQEMSGHSSICNTAKVGDTGRLMDTRDKKMYWVAKLADGKCWMTQNLDFDIPEILSARDTNVPYDIKLTVNKFTNATSVRGWGDDPNNLNYYDPGLFLITQPSVYTTCSTSVTSITAPECSSLKWVDASKLTANTSPSSNGNIPVTTSANVLKNDTYDSHYLIGNYYSWNTATAGLGAKANSTSNNQQNVNASICPKGWELPKAGRSYMDSSGSPIYLFLQYGLSDSSGNGKISGTGLSTNTATNGYTYTVYDAPLYIVASGYTSGNNIIYGRGSYWTSIGSYTNNAYQFYLDLQSSKLYPQSEYNPRAMGASIRCIYAY